MADPIQIFREKVCVLQITSWVGISIGAEHYYGILHFNGKQEELRKKLSRKEAKYLNIKNNVESSYGWHPGQMSNMFNDKKFIIELARKEYKKHFPEACVLVRGSTASLDPQEILDAPKFFEEIGMNLYAQAQKCNWWRNEKVMSRIAASWEKLLLRLEKCGA